MDKKGTSVGIQFLVVLIAALIFGFALLLLMKQFSIFGENLADYTICKQSNLANAKLKLKIGNQALNEPTQNKCKTEYVTVKKGMEIKTISKRLALCWDEYLEGKEDIFETGDNTFCAICAVLSFEDKKIISGEELTNYLVKTNVPQKGISYYQYLTNLPVQDIISPEIMPGYTNQGIDTSKKWATIFIMGKDQYPESPIGQSSIKTAAQGATISAVGGGLVLIGFGLCAGVITCSVGAILIAVGGGTTGYLIGSDKDPSINSRVLLWPYTNEDLAKLKCTVLEGRDSLQIRK